MSLMGGVHEAGSLNGGVTGVGVPLIIIVVDWGNDAANESERGGEDTDGSLFMGVFLWDPCQVGEQPLRGRVEVGNGITEEIRKFNNGLLGGVE